MRVGRSRRVTRRGKTIASNASHMMTMMQRAPAAAVSEPMIIETHPSAPPLDDISVDVERGSALTLVGPSGSGKSSLLRCLNRLEEPTAGVVRFDGRPITEIDPRELRRRAALVLQTAVLFEGTVREN